jgi:hypothetical protein
LAITSDENWFAHVLTGSGYAENLQFEPALQHLRRANELMPGRYDTIIADLVAERDRRQRNAPVTP